MELKDFIKKYRIEHDLSMEQFGKMACLSKGYVSMLEKGVNPKTKKKLIPSLTVLNNLASAMNIDLTFLLESVEDLEVSVDKDSQNIGISIQLSEIEETLIKKYRQLNANDKQEIMNNIDFKLFQYNSLQKV